MSKEKEIEFLKENVINIIDDNFTLNIDYYINNKSLDFFQKVFNIKKETKNYKKTLEKESQKLKEILRAIDDIIFVINNNEIILKNKNVDILTYNSKSKKYFDTIKYNSLIKKIKSILTSKENIKEDFFLTELNKYYLIESYRLETEHSIIISLRDITITKNFEKIQKDFISNVSHELKTPLTNIKGYTIALEESIENKDENMKTFFKIINSNINKIDNLIYDFLNYSKFEGFKILNLSYIKADELINETLFGLTLLINNKNAKIQTNFDLFDENNYIYIDAEKIKLVMKNLIENALIYSSEKPEINVEIAENNDTYTFRIADNGLGISEEEQDKIFEKFYRVDKSRPMNFSGSGLGLAIVKEIVNNYNSEINLTSNSGVGSTFSIIIPK
ncbi:cell wall metabolism sensor histidine kinase WalK [Sebaldella sp. S0638]|uniref:sensor histidine kinase n=1 Tax=Sebaldella sp. S0638 TaxID=2957809 RepID=UPI00209FE836|nr:ATP-binding protein [Sebaldella sp. S0638]MCP1224116.1 ATP-binding protein [Sebaldella sp. S0638]